MFLNILGSSFLITFLTLTYPLAAIGSVTVYYQQGQSVLAADTTATGTAAAASYTGSAAYNPTELEAPAPPGSAALPTTFNVALQNSVPAGASIVQGGGFFGFSVEMSVANQVLGTNASVLQVPFLNLMANIQERAGRVYVRVGGNTQETAVLVDQTSDGKILEKDLTGVTNPTATPPLVFTPELLYMLRNISSLVNVRWFLGVPFNDSANWRLGIVERGQQILGDYLEGFQAGNEPDLYADHGHRTSTYGPYDYFGEFGLLISALEADTKVSNPHMLIGPSVSSGEWTPEQVWDTGYVDSYTSSLAYLSVEHYPSDNCYAQYQVGTPRDPQTMFPTYLNHSAPLALLGRYLNSTAYAQTKSKKLLMFETNTASCGGFVGISDAFGAALWGVDYGMQLAYSNFSGGLFHVGGQNVYYNPFTPPPTNQSTFRKWSIGPIYYSALVVAEALGPSNNTQVVDLQANNNNIYSPAYAIYESGTLQRVLLMNYVTDSTGASNLNVSLSLTGGTMESSVQVKYLLASSVSQKGNYTWAGQTFGMNFESDGRPTGTEDIQTVSCTSGVCMINVPAPGVALVFMTSSAMTDGKGAASQTFPTTYYTKTKNTVTVDASVLATSNGHTGMDKISGSTSEGSVSAAGEAGWRDGILGRSLLGVVLGVVGGVVLCLGVV